MGLTSLMTNYNKGQMRIVEAMITCTILVAGLAVSIRMSNVYTVTERGSIEKSATNIVSVLEDLDVVSMIANNESSWEIELRELLRNLLPPDTFYQLTLRSALTGKIIGDMTNMAGSYNSSGIDCVSEKRVVTISLPLGKGECKPLDVMLIVDMSGSMGDRLPGDVRTKIDGAKEAAKLFIDELNASVDKVGLVSFNQNAYLRSQLTDDFAAVKSAIDALTANGYTNIGDGIGYATNEFIARGRSGTTVWVMVLLSDGKANRPTGMNATQYALDKAKDAYEKGSNQSLRIYTIGLGAKDDIDEPLLKQIAKGPFVGITYPLEGKYYYAPSAEDLSDIYVNIAKDLMFKVEYDVIILELTLLKPR